MNSFMGLIKKDWILSRKTALLTVWIVGGMMILSVILAVSAYFYHGFEFNIFDLQGVLDGAGKPLDIAVYIMNVSLVNFPGMLALIFAAALAGGALNNDSQKHCEVFYRIQPVSFWKVTASRFIVTIGGNLAVLLAVLLGLFIITNTFGYLIIGTYSLWTAFKGLMLGYIEFALIILVVGSFGFLCSSIFKDKAFAKGLGIIIIVSALIAIINLLFQWAIPQPIFELGKFLFEFDVKDIGLREAMNWSILFRWEHLWKIVFAGVTYVVGSFLYKIKEVK